MSILACQVVSAPSAKKIRWIDCSVARVIEKQFFTRLPATKPESLGDAPKRTRGGEREVCGIESRAQTLEDAAFDLKAVNPNAKSTEDTRSSAELIDLIETKGREIQELLAQLRQL